MMERVMHTRLAIGLLLLAALVAPMIAQAPPSATREPSDITMPLVKPAAGADPVLTPEQAATLKVAMLEWQAAQKAASPRAIADAIAEYLAQVREAEAQAAAKAQKVYAALPQIEGWRLDPNTGRYQQVGR